MSTDPMDLSAEQRARLDARTRSLAAPSTQEGESEGEIDVVVMRSGRDRYGIPGAAVRAVAPLTRLSPLPHGPPHVAGLTSFRGGIVVVFYLHAAVGAAPSVSEHGRMVVLDEGCAIAVDAIESIERIAPMRLLGPPEGLAAETAKLIEGVTASGIAILRIEALMASDRLAVDIDVTNVGTFASRR
jgi:purine-binding chemotaxis protein CheW